MYVCMYVCMYVYIYINQQQQGSSRHTHTHTHTTTTTTTIKQEGLPRFQRIAPEAVVPGIRQLSTQFTERFQALEGAWKGQVRGDEMTVFFVGFWGLLVCLFVGFCVFFCVGRGRGRGR
jgi:hypothetical protein